MKKSFFLFIVLLSFFTAKAQYDTTYVQKIGYCSEAKGWVGVNFFKLFYNGFEADFGKKIGEKKYVSLTPTFYYQKISGLTDQKAVGYKDVLGFGLNAGLHLMLREDTAKRSAVFFSTHVGFNRFALDFLGYSWVLKEVDGLRFYTYEETDIRESISRLDIQFRITYRKQSLYIPLNFDFYFGLGFQKPWVNNEISDFSNFERNIFSYAYKGAMPKIGLLISKRR